jgi:hypothetical protein
VGVEIGEFRVSVAEGVTLIGTRFFQPLGSRFSDSQRPLFELLAQIRGWKDVVFRDSQFEVVEEFCTILG